MPITQIDFKNKILMTRELMRGDDEDTYKMLLKAAFTKFINDASKDELEELIDSLLGE